MTSITVRNVPEDARDRLAARAALSGRSLQEYLRMELIDLASRPSPDEVRERIRSRKRATGAEVHIETLLALRDADRR